jgi:Protein of unknown function DUF45
MQARAEIERHLAAITVRVRQRPQRVYVMGQRTKWGNCSSRKNLSFNWRLILAPDFVLRYLVIHEAVPLAIPDHSAKFWLAVQSLCLETERAKQWLSANGWRLALEWKSFCEKRQASLGGYRTAAQSNVALQWSIRFRRSSTICHRRSPFSA